MSKPASTAELGKLHALFAKYLADILEEAQGDSEDALPLDAATMGVISKFLKDNNITADPADADALKELRERFSKQKQGVKSAIAEAAEDTQGRPYLQ